jgi:NADH-quinone oxidoreductase subunit J
MELVVFVLAAAMILVGAVGVIVRSNPVHAALSLILTLFGVAVMFVAQNAHFLAAVQVIVYAGAIVVLFLSSEPFKVQRPLAAIVGLGVIGLVVAAVVSSRDAITVRGTGLNVADTVGDGDTNIKQLARSVFGDYVVAFEVTSVLLVVAVVGTVLLTRRVKGSGKDS